MNEEYSAYLNSDAWRAKRLHRLAISNFRCSACRDDKAIHVHHLTYARIFNEDMSDLLPLCEAHHKAAERLIKNGDLPRHGDVLFLATETIRLIVSHAPRECSSRSVRHRAREARNPIQEALLSHQQFRDFLKLDRKTFKQIIKKWIRKSHDDRIKGKRGYANAFTLYDLRFKRHLI